jgi:hypothetical protein
MFRFAVRDLLWLTLVVAMGFGWFVRERQLGSETDRANRLQGVAERLRQLLRECGTEVTWNLETDWWTITTLNEKEWEAVKATSPRWKPQHSSNGE